MELHPQTDIDSRRQFRKGWWYIICHGAVVYASRSGKRALATFNEAK